MKNNEKIKLLAYISVIIIGIINISTIIYFFSSKHNCNIDNQILGTMLTAISIIVAMGVGYSTINIHDYSNKVNKLNHNFKSFTKSINYKYKNFASKIEKDLNENISNLEFNNTVVKLETELNRKNMAAQSHFESGSYLQALKTEFDILVFLFENYKYFKDEFNSHTGIKRKFISNDLLICIEKVNKKYTETTKPGEVKDFIKVIFRNIHLIEKSPAMKELYEEEQKRFKIILSITDKIVQQIAENSFPLEIDSKEKEKLELYNNIICGDKPDDNQYS